MHTALALLSYLLLFLTPPAEKVIGRIENSAGAAVLLRGEKVLAPIAGTNVEADDILRTEQSGLLRVVLSDGSTLLASENTEFRIAKHDTETQLTTIELLHGRLLSQSMPVTKSGGRYQI